MYSDKGPKVTFGNNIEYDAQFKIDWDKIHSVILTISACITKGYLVDVTKNVDRDLKLIKLGL